MWRFSGKSDEFTGERVSEGARGAEGEVPALTGLEVPGMVGTIFPSN